jgi:hypothetical protein
MQRKINLQLPEINATNILLASSIIKMYKKMIFNFQELTQQECYLQLPEINATKKFICNFHKLMQKKIIS